MINGKIVNNNVRIYDGKSVSALHGQGFGTMKKGCLDLNLLEAAHLIEKDKLEVSVLQNSGQDINQDIKKRAKKLMSFVDFLKFASRAEENFETERIVYNDLKSKGYSITWNKDFLMAHGKRIKIFSENDIFVFSQVVKNLKKNKDFVACIVDEESDITSYLLSVFHPPKLQTDLDSDNPEKICNFLNNRVVSEVALNDNFGVSVGSIHELSLIEAVYLLKNGRIAIDEISEKDLFEIGNKKQKDFELIYRGFEDLRNRGYVAKTGFKYGTHFRVYDFRLDKIHAPYIAHCYPKKFRARWNEISRASRLAHSVKKKMLFMVVGDEINYIKCERIKV